MEGYSSEQEQVEAVKRWWRNNGKSILAGVTIGVLVLIGGRLWIDHKNNQTLLAEDQYEQVLADLQRGEKAAAVDRGARLLEENRGSPYAALTALVLAKLKMDDNDQDGAKKYLQWVIDNAGLPSLQDVARLRLARVLLAAGDGAAALSTMQAVDEKAYTVPMQELKGDILVSLNRLDEARTAYAAALAGEPEGGEHERLQMKMSALGGAKTS
ncbi:MAG: tetratricopeptide repeat protein [Pseudomonadota bacterium]